MKYKVSIGLETHVQLKTRSKIWCGCPNRFGQPANTDICPVCLGYPGALPSLNREAVRLTVVTGLMLGSTINRRSKFDRKSYFYPDMPKNYQISQYDEPFCTGGHLNINVNGGSKRVEITRIHLEEDVGKSIHFEQSSGVDFNRAGTPLMEIVSEPELESPDEAFAYLTALKQVLLYGDISEGNLEEGNIRCDINCSLRPMDSDVLGSKIEIKNMNTFRGVHRSLVYEIKRQIGILDNGGVIQQETRRWDDDSGLTSIMRTKEHAHDYRYFPEPDLMPIVLTSEEIDAMRSAIPELPADRRNRFAVEYGLPEYDAGILTSDRDLADFYEAAAKISGNYKAVSNWIMTDMLHYLSEEGIGIDKIKITPEALAELVDLVVQNTINMPAAKKIFRILLESGGKPTAIMEDKGLAQISDSDSIDVFVEEALSSHPSSVADYRSGKKAALQFLVGQVMRLSKGKANPRAAMESLKRRLDSGDPGN